MKHDAAPINDKIPVRIMRIVRVLRSMPRTPHLRQREGLLAKGSPRAHPSRSRRPRETHRARLDSRSGPTMLEPNEHSDRVRRTPLYSNEWSSCPSPKGQYTSRETCGLRTRSQRNQAGYLYDWEVEVASMTDLTWGETERFPWAAGVSWQPRRTECARAGPKQRSDWRGIESCQARYLACVFRRAPVTRNVARSSPRQSSRWRRSDSQA